MATELTPEEELYYQEAEELAHYDALSLKAMALWAYEHRKSKEAMRIASFVWQRNARYLARAVELFGEIPAFADGDEHAFEPDKYLILFSIASLPKEHAFDLYEEWAEWGLKLYEVRERVDLIKHRALKSKPPRVCPKCGAIQ